MVNCHTRQKAPLKKVTCHEKVINLGPEIFYSMLWSIKKLDSL